ncbi:pentatricopeptide repeat-containing protein At1g33350 [Lycium barbarum]|uniref:pentatricopeptide repeat-containing protein At1g33350 n=1 Tax=Lycium barbarum TaxID=112863 RepID=UPI00293E4B5C|nr:pentatricopeptide repeat-containing protein At1g33350 [Lycium barbarum]
MLVGPNIHQDILVILDKCKSLTVLKQLQSHLITIGHGQTQLYAFKLVRFCTISLSNLYYARLIFNYINLPNVYLYTAMITAYTSVLDHNSSILLYRGMFRNGWVSKPNHFVFPIIMKSLTETTKLYGVEMAHNNIEKMGFGKYPVVQTALLDAYSRFSSDIRVARQLFDEITERNVVSWTAMISGYTRVGQMGDAILLFEEVPRNIRDTPSWNSIIAGCTQNGLFSEAISMLRRMTVEEGNNKPNDVTFACVLAACGHTGMLQLGKCIHGYMYRNNLNSSSLALNALIDMYGKCGSLKEARNIFDKANRGSLTCWNSMINCLALQGHWEGAVGVFKDMLRHGDDVKPDAVTFIGLFSACTHGGLVDEGLSYYDLMTQVYGINPEIEHYGCLIDLLGRAGRFVEIMKIVREMHITPDAVIWGSLLNGCKIHGRIDLAEYALDKLISIDPNNGSYYSMLANLYGELGKWDEVRRVRKILNQQNAHKPPGCSWIELDSQVHQFYSVDKSHPKMEEIYSILECLVDSH